MNRTGTRAPDRPSGMVLLVGGILLPLALFSILAAHAGDPDGLWFDYPVQMFFRSLAGPRLDSAMSWATLAGSRYALLPANLLLFLWLVERGQRREAVFWSAAVVGAGLLDLIVKPMVARERPALWATAVHETGFGFPSGHAMLTMAAMTALCILAWRTRWRWRVVVAAGAFVVLVAASRVYLGAHYPSDVLAGLAAALAWVMGLRLLIWRDVPPRAPDTPGRSG